MLYSCAVRSHVWCLCRDIFGSHAMRIDRAADSRRNAGGHVQPPPLSLVAADAIEMDVDGEDTSSCISEGTLVWLRY